MLDRLRDLLERRETLVLAGDLIPILSPLAVIPPREETQGLFLGVDDKGRNIYINPFSLPNVHGVLLGTSGSGKSTLARHLIIEARNLGVKTWVIDPHGEDAYRRLFRKTFIVTQDKIDFLYTPGWETKEYASELSRYIEIVYGFRGARNVIRELLLECISENSLLPLERMAREDPDLKRLYDDLNRIYSRDLAIEAIAEESVYFTFPLMVSRELVEISIQILLLLLQGWKRSRGVRNDLEQIVVLEEAHLFTPYLLSLYKEIRKWGYSLIAVSQLPREFDPRIFQLAGFVIILSGSESYVRDISLLFSLNADERDHVLFASHGTALYFRQGDPRPRKVFLKVHPEALSTPPS
ncbi:MAG: DUF87 domain-containing protein [Infirmifilum sp.]